MIGSRDRRLIGGPESDNLLTGHPDSGFLQNLCSFWRVEDGACSLYCALCGTAGSPLNPYPQACRAAVVAALTPENALSSLIYLDRYKETKDGEDKDAVIAFIKINHNDVIKSPEWLPFYKDYQPLVAEIMMAL